MKPVIIYSMPRSRSTAIMHSCKRSRCLFEPFDFFTLFGDTGRNSYDLYPHYSNSVPDKKWESIKTSMEDPNSVTKFFGISLYSYYPARKWFVEVDNAESHDIFVAVRDRREQAFSYLLACKFGWFKDKSVEPFEFTVDNRMLFNLARMQDAFLRFFPKNAKLIDFDNLPETHFDKSLNKLKNQDSLNNISYIKNIDHCEEQIASIIKCYDSEWRSKLSSIDAV